MHLADSFCPIWLVTQLWISLLFTSRQKQNGFLFRSGCKQANFCIKWNYCFAKNEESHVFQSWVILCVEVFFKAISHGLNKITKSFKYSLYYLVYNYYWSCNIKSFKFSFCLLWYILKQLFTSVSVNSARINQHFNPCMVFSDAFKGYLGRDYFIATQSPLPDTINDFWRLVYWQKSSTIVLLNNVKDGTVLNIY